MEKIWNWIQLAFAAIGGWLGWILGGLDGFLYALVAFVVIDYITGVMCAVVDKKLDSSIGFHGIFKKVLIFCMVAVAHIIDTQILGVAGDGSAIRTAVIFFYLANEGLSILENTTRLGFVDSVLERHGNILFWGYLFKRPRSFAYRAFNLRQSVRNRHNSGGRNNRDCRVEAVQEQRKTP